jgi:hypothetical protein
MKTYIVTVDEYGTKRSFFNNGLHRTDGPAIEWSNGTKSWYLNGVRLTKSQWRKRVQKIKTPCVWVGKVN